MPADLGSASERQHKLLRTGWPCRLTGDPRPIGSGASAPVLVIVAALLLPPAARG